MYTDLNEEMASCIGATISGFEVDGDSVFVELDDSTGFSVGVDDAGRLMFARYERDVSQLH